MKITEEERQQHLQYRKETYVTNVAIENDGFFRTPFIRLNRTTNGFQWDSLVFLPHEAKETIQKLQEGLDGLKHFQGKD